MSASDKRVRIRPKDGAEDYIYGAESDGSSLLNILRETEGLVWPSTPIISVEEVAKYEKATPTHSLTTFSNYHGTEDPVISVSGDFHVGNATDAYYLLACTHFLRTLTKMDFGKSSDTRGTPPPVMLFSAYGRYQFNDVPVIIEKCSFQYRDDVDYIQVPIDSTSDFGYYNSISDLSDYFDKFHENSDTVWVPQVMNINVSMSQQPSGSYLSNTFNLNSFKKGDLLIKGGFI